MVNGIYMLVGVSLGEGFSHVVKKINGINGLGQRFLLCNNFDTDLAGRASIGI
jgi:hypothetical protein